MSPPSTRHDGVVISHYNVQPVFDVYANVDGRDLGGVADDVRGSWTNSARSLPGGSFITMRGQVDSMDTSFAGLGVGVLFAIVLVYLLMVVNFQSWLDPFIIIMALTGALSGIVWMLFLTRTTLSVPSLMGAIMSIGVATANSILLVTFANDQRKEGKDARAAALAAGHTRLRPVLMTALAMIIGMLPMSLGFGEGGEQNAPLGRAVIGGLLLDRRHALPRAGRLCHPAQEGRPPPRRKPSRRKWAKRTSRARPPVLNPTPLNFFPQAVMKPGSRSLLFIGLGLGSPPRSSFLGVLPRLRAKRSSKPGRRSSVITPSTSRWPQRAAATPNSSCPRASRPSWRRRSMRGLTAIWAGCLWTSATGSRPARPLAIIDGPGLRPAVEPGPGRARTGAAPI